MAELYTYNPAEIIVTVAGKEIGGFANDEFVRVVREANAFEDEVGTDGEVTRYMTNDRRGSLTVTLMQSSPSNLVLTELSKADELSGAGLFPVVVKDNRGTDLHVAPQAWIQKIPQATYRKGVESREWVIRTNELQTVVGGN